MSPDKAKVVDTAQRMTRNQAKSKAEKGEWLLNYRIILPYPCYAVSALALTSPSPAAKRKADEGE